MTNGEVIGMLVVGLLCASNIFLYIKCHCTFWVGRGSGYMFLTGTAAKIWIGILIWFFVSVILVTNKMHVFGDIDMGLYVLSLFISVFFLRQYVQKHPKDVIKDIDKWMKELK